MMSRELLLIGLLGALQVAPALAQSSVPVSQEVRDLAVELEAGEPLTAPTGDANQPQSVAESEPANDAFGTANLVSINGVASGTIERTGDVDWWRIRAERRGALTVRSAEVPSEIDLSVRLWDANANAITGWVAAPSAGGMLEAQFDLPSGGDFRLEIRDGRNDASSDTPYQLQLVFTAVPETWEPNDRIGEATPLPIDSATEASILPKGDVDWLAIDADDQGELTVKVGAPPKALDLAVRLWNADGQAVSGWVGANAPGAVLDASFDLARPGRYFLELRDGRNDARSAEPFEVALNLRPTAEAGEPNDEIASATALGFEETIEAAILPKGDVDWYAIDAPAQGELTVSLTGSPENLDLSFRVFDTNANAITGWYSPLAVGGENINFVDLPRPGRYLIEVRDGRNDGRSPDPYQIGATFTATADANEPNGSPGSATELTPGQPYPANILPKGEADYYAVTVPEQSAMTVSLTDSPKDLDLSFRVWTPSFETMTGWYAPLAVGGENVQVVDIASPGRYLIEVRDGRNDARSSQPYTVTVELQPTGDGFEPNDAIGSASLVGLGETVTGSILPKGDADWYRIDVDAAGALRAAISESPDNLDMSVRFWDSSAKAITGWKGPLAVGGPVEAEVQIKAAGSHYVEVRDGRNDARSPAAYSLTLTHTPE